MLHETQAEMFMRVLSQLVENKRKSRDARLRMQHKAHAERYLQACRVEHDDTARPSKWTLHNMQVARESEFQHWDE